jgi:transporter family protein
MWIVYALLGAVTAALVAIFAKLGLAKIDATLASTVRGVIMAGFLVATTAALGKFNGFSFSSFTNKEWFYIFLAGLAGALSWLFSFYALKYGPASGATAIDKLSLVFVVVAAAFIFGESITWKSGAGVVLMTAGALLIAFK